MDYEPKIAACVICRGTEETIPDLIRSIKKQEIDFLNVTLNQQQDEKLIKQTCEEVELDYKISYFDWCDDTGKSRQYNLESLPSAYDWAIWLDSDDTLESNGDATLRKLIKKVALEGDDIVWLWYHYSFNESGSPTNMFIRERVFRTSIIGSPEYAEIDVDGKMLTKPMGKKLFWYGVIHEILMNCDLFQNTRTDDLYVKHHPKEEDRASRNEPQLLKAMEENPDNPRFVMYMAHHHSASGKPMLAYHWYMKFAGMKEGSVIERWQAYHYAAGSARNLGLYDLAEEAALKAISLMPEIVDPYIELGIINYYKKDYTKAKFWFKESDDKKKGSDLLFFNPMYITNDKDIHRALTMGAEGNFREAVGLISSCVERNPKSMNLIDMHEKFREANIRNETIRGLKSLCVSLLQHGELEKLKKVVDIIPWWIEEVPTEYYALVDGIAKHTSILKTELNEKFYNNIPVGGGAWINPKGPRYQWLVQMCDYLYPDGAKILDVGGGNGVLAELLTKHNVFVVEPNPVNCQALEDKGIKYAKKFFLDFKAKEHFDIVIMTEYLEHVLDYQKHIDKALEIGTHLLTTTPRPTRGNFDKELVQDHLRIFTLTDTENFVISQAGRRLEEMFIGPSNTTDMEQTFTHISHRPWDTTKTKWKFYENASPINWNPHFNTVGGSELALREVANSLDKIEDTVFVYYKGDKQVYHGVPYRPAEMFPAKAESDAIVSSRCPVLFNEELEGKKKFLWAHDVHYGDTYNEEIEGKIDAVFLESDFHMQKWLTQYPWSTKAKIVGGGITTALFEEEPARPYSKAPKFIYASSPLRGLARVLTMWPLIQEVYPDATLDIFYGWDWYDSAGGNEKYPNFKFNIMSIVESLKGVEWHGRIAHENVVKCLYEGDIWLYPPNDFEEVYCAQAVECQAAGMMCFYRENGALPEVVGDRGIPLPMDISDEDIVELIKKNWTEENQKYFGGKAREWAMKQSWSKVADNMKSYVN